MNALATAGRRVTYYEPFSHYLAADLFRLGLAFAAVGLGLIVLLLARQRWSEDRRSASWFLLSIIASMATHAWASLVGLGRPPTWPLLLARAAVFVVVAYASSLVVGEARRGAWARRQ